MRSAGCSVGRLQCAPRWGLAPWCVTAPRRAAGSRTEVSSDAVCLQQQRGRVPRRREMAFPALPRRGRTGFEPRFCATSTETAQRTPGESKSEPRGRRQGWAITPAAVALPSPSWRSNRRCLSPWALGHCGLVAIGACTMFCWRTRGEEMSHGWTSVPSVPGWGAGVAGCPGWGPVPRGLRCPSHVL